MELASYGCGGEAEFIYTVACCAHQHVFPLHINEEDEPTAKHSALPAKLLSQWAPHLATDRRAQPVPVGYRQRQRPARTGALIASRVAAAPPPPRLLMQRGEAVRAGAARVCVPAVHSCPTPTTAAGGVHQRRALTTRCHRWSRRARRRALIRHRPGAAPPRCCAPPQRRCCFCHTHRRCWCCRRRLCHCFRVRRCSGHRRCCCRPRPSPH